MASANTCMFGFGAQSFDFAHGIVPHYRRECAPSRRLAYLSAAGAWLLV